MAAARPFARRHHDQRGGLRVMTHQDIVDRLQAVTSEQSAAYLTERARVQKDRESLQELCGGIGHVFRLNVAYFSLVPKRTCVFCDCAEQEPT